MFYTRLHSPGAFAYDVPFSPRFSVPTSFESALSYEGQIHWLAHACENAYKRVESLHSAFYVATAPKGSTPAEFTNAELASIIGTDYTFKLYDDDGTESGTGHGAVPDVMETGDLLLIDAYCTTDSARCVIVGTVVGACGCNAEYVEVTAHIRAAIRDVSGRIDGIDERLTALEKTVAGHTVKIGDIETRLGVAETTISNHETRISANETDLSDLKKRVSTLETRYTELASRMSTAETAISTLQTSVSSLQATVASHTTSIAKNATSVSSIVNKVAGGGTIASNGNVTFAISGYIPIGNINVYSQSSDPASTSTYYIRSHTGVAANNDVWFKATT